MKKYFIYACLLLVAGCFVSCNNDEDIDTKTVFSALRKKALPDLTNGFSAIIYILIMSR